MKFLHPLFMAHRWNVAKILAPTVILLLGVFVIIPILDHNGKLHRDKIELQSAISNQAQFALHVDSLHADLKALLSFKAGLDSLHHVVVPTIDSLRKSAEQAKLKVSDLADEGKVAQGFASTGRLELFGNYADMLAWLDHLDSLSPDLQVIRFQWNPGKTASEARLSGFVLGGGKSNSNNVQASTENIRVRASQWKDRYASWTLRNSPHSDTSLVNPFAGHVAKVEHKAKVVEKPVAVAAPKPMQPAPKLKVIGLIAGRMATVNTEKGERTLLRIGDAVGEWTVESITANSLVLTNQGQRKAYP